MRDKIEAINSTGVEVEELKNQDDEETKKPAEPKVKKSKTVKHSASKKYSK